MCRHVLLIALKYNQKNSYIYHGDITDLEDMEISMDLL